MNKSGGTAEILLALELFCEHVEKAAIRKQAPEPNREFWNAVLETTHLIDKKMYPEIYRQNIAEKQNDLISEIKNHESTLESKCLRLQHIILALKKATVL